MSPTAYSTPSDARDQVTTANLIVQAAEKKWKEPIAIQFYKAFNAGALLAFGCTLALVAGSSPTEQTDNAGLAKIIAAAVFPIGLVALILLGQELMTGTMMTVLMAVLKGRISPLAYPVLCTVHFFGNLCGALAFAAFLAHWSELFAAAPYSTYVQTFATGKVVTPEAQNILLRGIGCNVLVCIAVWLSVQARETFSKVVVLWFPIFAFVGIGFDHVVANMLFIPLAIMQGSPTIDTALYIRKSMLPSLVGNFIGAWLIAVPFTVMYLTKYGGAIPELRDSGAANQADEESGSNVQNGHSSGSFTEKVKFWRSEKQRGSGSAVVQPVESRVD